jgi:hypothetical protein
LRADEYGGHGAQQELALGADVPELGPEGDGDGEAGQHQGRRLDDGLDQVELAVERAGEEHRVGLDDVGAGQRDEAAAEHQGRGDRGLLALFQTKFHAASSR